MGNKITKIEGGLKRDLENGKALILYFRMFNNLLVIGVPGR